MLRFYRQQAGLSQEKLAEIADYGQSYVSRIEAGKRQPTRETVLRFSRALGLPADIEDRMLVAAGYAPEEVHTLLTEPRLADLDNLCASLPEAARERVLVLIDGAISYASGELAAHDDRA